MADQATPKAKQLNSTAIVLLAACVAMGPLFVTGPACGSDFAFHFSSWIDAEHSMTMGLLYPHWANSPNYGAGDPRFVFYPPLSWMSGAILGAILPWGWVPLILFVALLAATGLANRALAREVLDDGPATLAGCASIFIGYALFNVYKRCDFSELAGGFLIPLLLLHALRRRNASGSVWQRAFDGSATPMTAVIAACWLSNGPVAIMACYLLAAVAVVCAATERSMAPVLRAAVSVVLGVGLSALYLTPAFWQRSATNIEYAATHDHFAIETSWLFARHDDPAFASHDMLLSRASNVAVIMLAVALLGVLIAWLRGAMRAVISPAMKKKRAWWLPLALIPPTVLFLLFPVSEFVWNWAPQLRLLQVPWRWLVVLEAPMALFFGAAAATFRSRARIAIYCVSAVVFAATSIGAYGLWFTECGESEQAIQRQIQQRIGVPSRPEYAPPGIRDAQVDRPVHDACLLNANAPGAAERDANPAPSWDGEAATCTSNFQAAMFVPEQKAISGVADHAGYLILRLRYFPAWQVVVNGVPGTAVAERERGFMAVPVAQGPVRVSVRWVTSADVIAGRWISAVSLLLFLMLRWWERHITSASQPALE